MSLRDARARYLNPKEDPGCTYVAYRREDNFCEVTVDGKPLDPRLDLWNHSPTGFGWGYAGSGPAQLALALLAHALEDDDLAVKLHQPFKAAYLVSYPGLIHRGWELTRRDVWHRALACAKDEDAPAIHEAMKRFTAKRRKTA